MFREYIINFGFIKNTAVNNFRKIFFKPIIKELTKTNNLYSEYFNYSNEKVKKYGFEIKNDIKDILINILNVTNKFYSQRNNIASNIVKINAYTSSKVDIFFNDYL